MAYTFLDLAHEVLKAASRPLTYQEIWEAAKATGAATKVKTSGKTPWQSLGAYLYVDVRDNERLPIFKGWQETCPVLLEGEGG